MPTKSKTPLLMFNISEDGENIRIPFRFGCCLFGTLFNRDRPHMQIVKDMTPKFEVSLRENQIPILEEAYRNLQEFSTTTLGVPPGTGKTIMSIFLAYLTGFCTLILCNRETIMKQWIETINKCIPAYAPLVWMVGVNKPPENGIPPFIICMDKRYHKIPESYINAVGTLVVDEAHMFCTDSQVPCLLLSQPRYIILCSATLQRDDGMHKMVQSMVGEHGIFTVSKVPYTIVKVRTRVQVQTESGKFGINYGKMCNSLAADEYRNNIIVDIVKTNPHRKFIILTNLANHVELLNLLLGQAGIESSTMYRNQRNYSDRNVLIGTMPKLGTGFDEANACEDFQGMKSDVLILAASVKKWQQYEQFRGRVMRASNPIVIWLYDDMRTTQAHFRGLKGWFEETKGQIETVNWMPGGVCLPENPDNQRTK